jgi:hypothetical protein
MCRVVTCRVCERPTWAGCGAHIEKALAHVPPAERCECPRESRGLGTAIRSLFGGKRS